MRTVTHTIYKYDELPTEKAKEKARDWWWGNGLADPAFEDEYHLSLKAAKEALGRELSPEELQRQSEACEFTGCIYDGILAHFIRSHKRRPSESELKYAYRDAWSEDLIDGSKRTNIEEEILANDYEFYEDGSVY